jgi:hypothetical protein
LGWGAPVHKTGG